MSKYTIEMLMTKHYETSVNDKAYYKRLTNEEHFSDIIESLIFQVVELTNRAQELEKQVIMPLDKADKRVLKMQYDNIDPGVLK